MRTILLAPVFLLGAVLAAAQVEKEDVEREKALREKAEKTQADTSARRGWHHSLSAGANITQQSFTDWAAGGENSLAYTLRLGGLADNRGDLFDWLTTYRFSFGQARLSNQGLRKIEDEIYFESILLYRMGLHLNPYASLTFRTQFAPGFQYGADGTKLQVSRFFDPAYITQSAGMAYRPVPEVVTRLGLAVREIVTSAHTQYANDPATAEVEKTRVLGGAEWVTDVNWAFAENMQYQSKLEVFSPFSTPDRMVVRWDNGILAKVNEYISAALALQMLYDEIILPRTQVKQGLAIGITYTLL